MVARTHQRLIDEVCRPVVAHCLVDVVSIAPPGWSIASRPSTTTVAQGHGHELAVGRESGAGAEIEHDAFAFCDHSVQLAITSQSTSGLAADGCSTANDHATGRSPLGDGFEWNCHEQLRALAPTCDLTRAVRLA